MSQEEKKSLNVQGTVFLGLGFQFLERQRLFGINRTFLGSVRLVPGNRPVSSQEPGCSSKLTTAFQDAYKHYPHKLDKHLLFTQRSAKYYTRRLPTNIHDFHLPPSDHRVLRITLTYISSDLSLYLLTLHYCGIRLPRGGYLVGNQFAAVF